MLGWRWIELLNFPLIVKLAAALASGAVPLLDSQSALNLSAVHAKT
jgi:hypothetical protein